VVPFPSAGCLASLRAIAHWVAGGQVTQADIAAVKATQEAQQQAQREAAALEKKRITVPGELEANSNMVRARARSQWRLFSCIFILPHLY
jgi:hypothetical protein